jgi:nucleotide-binding universal stress UspA family protein
VEQKSQSAHKSFTKYIQRRNTMFKRILVPLDGSPRAESALTVAARVARATDGTIVLLQVVSIPATYIPFTYSPDMAQVPMYTEELMDTEQENTEKYLAEVANLDMLVGIKVEKTVIPGTAGMTIIDTAREEDIDVIVMCSHGETGFKRWALGSVAQHVSRHCSVPVLVLREDGTSLTSAFPDRLQPLHSIIGLVALDGSKMAEATLEPAANLVAALAAPEQGTLVLNTVVARNKFDKAEHLLNETRKYLTGIAERLKSGDLAILNLAIEWSIDESKDVADALIKTAESGTSTESSHKFAGCDLIAIATHGRGGMQRLVMGSVTERVLGATKLPMLIVRPKTE